MLVVLLYYFYGGVTVSHKRKTYNKKHKNRFEDKMDYKKLKFYKKQKQELKGE
jgi:hypothetical protein